MKSWICASEFLEFRYLKHLTAFPISSDPISTTDSSFMKITETVRDLSDTHAIFEEQATAHRMVENSKEAVQSVAVSKP